jgi:hypothetical protein
VRDLARDLAPRRDPLGGGQALAHRGKLVDGPVERLGELGDLPPPAPPHVARLPRDDLPRLPRERHDRPRQAAREDHRDGNGDPERGGAGDENGLIQLGERPFQAALRQRPRHAQPHHLGKIDGANDLVGAARGRGSAGVDGVEAHPVGVAHPLEDRRDPSRADQPDGDAAARTSAVHFHEGVAASRRGRERGNRLAPGGRRGDRRSSRGRGGGGQTAGAEARRPGRGLDERSQPGVLDPDPRDVAGAEHHSIAGDQDQLVELDRLRLIRHEMADRDQAARIERRGVALGAIEVEVGLVDEGVVGAERGEQPSERLGLVRELLADPGGGHVDAVLKVGLDDLARRVTHREADQGRGEDRHHTEGDEESKGERHGASRRSVQSRGPSGGAKAPRSQRWG